MIAIFLRLQTLCCLSLEEALYYPYWINSNGSTLVPHDLRNDENPVSIFFTQSDSIVSFRSGRGPAEFSESNYKISSFDSEGNIYIWDDGLKLTKSFSNQGVYRGSLGELDCQGALFTSLLNDSTLIVGRSDDRLIELYRFDNIELKAKELLKSYPNDALPELSALENWIIKQAVTTHGDGQAFYFTYEFTSDVFVVHPDLSLSVIKTTYFDIPLPKDETVEGAIYHPTNRSKTRREQVNNE